MAKKIRAKAKERVNKMFTVAEVAERTGLASTQILYRIKTGQIRAEKLGWFWVIPKEEVDRLTKGDDEE